MSLLEVPYIHLNYSIGIIRAPFDLNLEWILFS